MAGAEETRHLTGAQPPRSMADGWSSVAQRGSPSEPHMFRGIVKVGLRVKISSHSRQLLMGRVTYGSTFTENLGSLVLSARFLPLFPVDFVFWLVHVRLERSLLFRLKPGLQSEAAAVDYSSNAFSASSRHETISPGLLQVSCSALPICVTFMVEGWTKRQPSRKRAVAYGLP